MTATAIYHTHTPEQTERIGRRLAEQLERAGCRRALIALRGEMGVGKTAFVRGFASYFDVLQVKSPTYTIVNEYRGRVSLYHFDLYRIEESDELASIGFEDYLGRDGYCLLEWSEHVADELPPDAITVCIEREPEEESARTLTVLWPREEQEVPS